MSMHVFKWSTLTDHWPQTTDHWPLSTVTSLLLSFWIAYRYIKITGTLTEYYNDQYNYSGIDHLQKTCHLSVMRCDAAVMLSCCDVCSSRFSLLVWYYAITPLLCIQGGFVKTSVILTTSDEKLSVHGFTKTPRTVKLIATERRELAVMPLRNSRVLVN